MLDKTILVIIALLVSLSAYAQEPPWSTRSMLSANSEVSLSDASVVYFPEGKFIGEVDLDKGINGAMSSPFNSFVRYFNVNSSSGLTSVSYDKQKAREYPEAQLKATVERRRSGGMVYVETILQLETQESEKVAIVKFFVTIPGRPRPVFGIKIFQKRENIWLLRIANPEANFSYALLQCKTASLLEVIESKNETYGFISNGGVNKGLFAQSINLWMNNKSEYAKEYDYFIQNTGWQ